MYNQVHISTPVKKLMKKVENIKLMIFLEYQNMKIFFLQKITLQTGMKKFL